MTLAAWIRDELQERLHPVELVVTDESEQHHGHVGWREGGETHFRIHIVSDAFAGKSRVERHRLVNETLKGAFAKGLHALAIEARATGEPDPRGSRRG
ncbi:BolA family protein [Microvirga terricola]|uniref:BolA family transcriptional regulator n=1 Tax=Microvirga terricola TaxID=2719797 RepID=A0ABX0V5V4_9HYPH|nr:BolA family protein [Microvirga terricola]NIX75220.1 BolA family transcriptional regulator [Microvirga terricola]